MDVWQTHKPSISVIGINEDNGAKTFISTPTCSTSCTNKSSVKSLVLQDSSVTEQLVAESRSQLAKFAHHSGPSIRPSQWIQEATLSLEVTNDTPSR